MAMAIKPKRPPTKDTLKRRFADEQRKEGMGMRYFPRTRKSLEIKGKEMTTDKWDDGEGAAKLRKGGMVKKKK